MLDQVTKLAWFEGYISLLPHKWVQAGRGRWGQQYVHVEHDRKGNELSRTVKEPVAWLSWE